MNLCLSRFLDILELQVSMFMISHVNLLCISLWGAGLQRSEL